MNARFARYILMLVFVAAAFVVALNPMPAMAGGPGSADYSAGLTLKPTCYGTIDCGAVVVLQEKEDRWFNTRTPVGSATAGDTMGIYAWQRSQGLYGSVLTDKGSVVLWGWVDSSCVSYNTADCQFRGGYSTVGMPATGGDGYDWSTLYAGDNVTAAYAALPAWGGMTPPYEYTDPYYNYGYVGP